MRSADYGSRGDTASSTGARRAGSGDFTENPGALLQSEHCSGAGFSAVCGSGDEIFVEVDVSGIAPTTLALIVAKLGELPPVLNAVLVDAEH